MTGANNKQIQSKAPAMNNLPSQRVVRHLALADGSHFEIAAGDEEAATFVALLGDAMQLPATLSAPGTAHHRYLHHVLVLSGTQKTVTYHPVQKAMAIETPVICTLALHNHWGNRYVNLLHLSQVLARAAQAHGGLLIHGALAERDGIGVILAAPGGTGKTTASSRLPDPWRSLCDDTTLVTRDRHDNYLAHPWPTWSRFIDGGPDGAWDVQKAVPLKGIFFLNQAPEDRAEPVGAGQAVSLLIESAKQASMINAPHQHKEEVRAQHLEQFTNLCALASNVPAHVLYISLTGAFWQEIDQALSGTMMKTHSCLISR